MESELKIDIYIFERMLKKRMKCEVLEVKNSMRKEVEEMIVK
jgi:hypothetical protein